jgi:alcohol oxidase
VPRHVQPARFLKNLVPGSDVFTFNVGRPSKALFGRAPIVPSGRAVGGGSSVNCRLSCFHFQNQEMRYPTVMVYNRASASDYDAWETIYGNVGWGSDKLIPLLKKVIRIFTQER